MSPLSRNVRENLPAGGATAIPGGSLYDRYREHETWLRIPLLKGGTAQDEPREDKKYKQPPC